MHNGDTKNHFLCKSKHFFLIDLPFFKMSLKLLTDFFFLLSVYALFLKNPFLVQVNYSI